MMSGLAKHALSVAAFVIAFVAVKYGMHAYREHQSVAKVEQSLSQLQADATQKHPDVPVSVAVQQEATERASKKRPPRRAAPLLIRNEGHASARPRRYTDIAFRE